MARSRSASCFLTKSWSRELPVPPTGVDGTTVEIDTDDELVVLGRLVNWALEQGRSSQGAECQPGNARGRVPESDRVKAEAKTRARHERAGRRRHGPSWDCSGGLRLVGHELRYEQLSFWVNRVGAVFTVGFSVVFLVLLGSSQVTRGSRTSATSS